MSKESMPQFGPLAGIKVVSAGVSVAGPFAASMMADFGADVTFVESPFIKDQFRTNDSNGFLNKERRNHKAIALDVRKPEGHEVFAKLIAESDIFVENSKAGSWDKRGFSDEDLWALNPKLVIVHVSGFGQTGDPEILRRGSYDSIGQALSGFMNLNGEPDGEPMQAPAYIGDYITALHASWGALAAYINAQKTGKGESIDCAQYETILNCIGSFVSDYLCYGIERTRSGSSNPTFAGCRNFKCKDGFIYVFFLSTNVLKGGLPFLGLEFGSEMYPEDKYAVWKGTPGGDLLDERLTEYCAGKTVLEAEKELNDHGVTACGINNWEQLANHPQIKARGSIVEWEAIEGGTVKGAAICPRFKNNPGQVWRKAPYYGQDNEVVLQELGYADDQIKRLYDEGILNQDPSR